VKPEKSLDNPSGQTVLKTLLVRGGGGDTHPPSNRESLKAKQEDQKGKVVRGRLSLEVWHYRH